ncbi:MAG: DMT family transporter [Candidatus Marinimicrobia bacterium]|nr:DMT family transporter [Candidatus Neomarinimicrobiota bacterium]
MKQRVFILNFPMESDYLKSVLLMTISSLSFAVMSLMVRLAGDIPLLEKVLFRNFFSLLIALFIIMKNKQPVWGIKGNRKYLILRGVTGLIGVMLYFYSITHLTLSDATMLNKLSPFFVIIFASLFLKERLNRYPDRWDHRCFPRFNADHQAPFSISLCFRLSWVSVPLFCRFCLCCHPSAEFAG